MSRRDRSMNALALFAAMASGWGNVGCSEHLTIRTVKQETWSGAASARYVVRDAAAWANVWSQMICGHGGEPPSASVIDFSKETLIVVAMGSRPTTGYRIDVDDAQLEDGTVRISVTEHAPGDGCAVGAALTSPETVVAVPRFDGDPTFVKHTVFDDCK